MVNLVLRVVLAEIIFGFCQIKMSHKGQFPSFVSDLSMFTLLSGWIFPLRAQTAAGVHLKPPLLFRLHAVCSCCAVLPAVY